MNFLIISLTGQISCIYLLVDPGFYPPPVNFYEASRFVPHLGQTPLTDTIRTKRRTNGVRPSVS